jgi:hypothetical protein
MHSIDGIPMEAPWDADIALQESFATALDKLIEEYSKRGLGPRPVWVELTNYAASIEGDD